MKIFTVVGARPQFIKAAPLSRAIRQKHSEFLVHTGQHYDDAMSAIFFRQLGIPAPDVNLGVGSGTHGAQTAAMLQGIEALLFQEKPDWMLVYGDTNSTLAGALAASKLHIPIAHVEAGLRSYNRAMPEEVNRVLTDHLSTLLFCPTTAAAENLTKEGITAGVIMSGDIMVDAVLQNVARARQESSILQQLNIRKGNYLAATIHRPANTDNPGALQAIIDALAAAPLPVIFAAHPRTQKALKHHGIRPHGNARLIEPLGYVDMLALVESAAALITDSGGLQKEAYILKTPCVTIRTETEWVETVNSRWNRLTAADAPAILQAIESALAPPPPEHPDFYGDGNAAARMLEALERYHE